MERTTHGEDGPMSGQGQGGCGVQGCYQPVGYHYEPTGGTGLYVNRVVYPLGEAYFCADHYAGAVVAQRELLTVTP